MGGYFWIGHDPTASNNFVGFAGLVAFKRWKQRERFDHVLISADNGRTVRLELTLKTRLMNPSCAKIPTGSRRIVIAEPENREG